MGNSVIIASLVILPIFFYKTLILFVGYLVVKMGFTLLREGIKGEFKFRSSFSEYKADLVSVSPGTLFVLLGVILLVIAIILKNPYEIKLGNKDKAEPQTAKESVPSDKLLKEFWNE